jgi:hypothetical protein
MTRVFTSKPEVYGCFEYIMNVLAVAFWGTALCSVEFRFSEFDCIYTV